MFYNLGALTWIISGIMRAKHNSDGKFTKADISELMVGVVLGSGSLMLTSFGKDNKKHPMLAFSDGLSEYLKKQGVVLPTAADATPESIHKSGFFPAAAEFLKKNSVSVLALDKAAASGFVAYSATKKTNFNPAKLAGGIIYAGAWLATFALDKPDAPPYQFKSKDDGTPQSTSKKLWKWASDDPRGHITAPIGIATQSLKLYGCWDEGMKAIRNAKNALPADKAFAEARQYDFLWNVVGYGAFIMGNYLFGLSGKKQPSLQKEDPDHFEQEILTAAANILSSVPEKARKLAIEAAAEYVTSIKGIHHSQSEVEQIIANQITHLQQLSVNAPDNTAVLSH